MHTHVPAKGWMEALAAQEGEPDIHVLVEGGNLSDAQHIANWEAVVAYLSNLTVEQKCDYVPVPR